MLKSSVKWHSASVLTKIIAGFLTTKFIAVYIGAEGMALIGNMRSFLASSQSFATAGIYNGVVKYISQYRHDAVKLSKTLSTTYYVGFVTTMLISFLCYFNADNINILLFSETYDFGYVIKIMSLAMPFYALNVFSFSIMNGFEKYKFLMIINIIGQSMGLAVTLLLIYQNKLDGALISVVISPSLIFLITVVGILNRRNLSPAIRVKHIDFEWMKKLSPYAMMAVVSGIAFPLIIIAVRSYIIKVEGLTEAGYWEAMNRISSYYLLFINSIMALYFLPRFAEIDTKKEFKREVWDFYKTVVPFFLMGLVLLYVLRHFIVELFLNKDFAPVEDLFGWQLLGDLVKVLALVIAYQFIAKKMFWHFIIAEVGLILIIYFSSVYFVDQYGTIGANIAHFVSYVVYYLVIIMLLSSSLFQVDPEEKISP